MNPSVTVLDAGRLDYASAWDLQLRLHEQVVGDPDAAFLLLVEHDPVITLGKNASDQFVLLRESMLAAQGVQFVRSDRGGEATAHNPGQLVVYPIIPLARFGLGARTYIQLLESCVIDCLADFGLPAGRDEVHPGVWVGKDKICAVGTRIKDRVSMHGIALNVDNDLSIFNFIVPCGISGRGVCSVASLLGSADSDPPSMTLVKAKFINHFGKLFRCVTMKRELSPQA
ncbi:MAG: hypothetical protein RIQ81_402 [Pseudomonadota bacterium]|jgi:lipoate-protein ligase B